MTVKSIVLVSFMLLFSFTCFASGKIVKCRIEASGSPTYNGDCLFEREKGGSFSLSNVDTSKPVFDGIGDVSVYIVEKDIGEVRGLTKEGINSRWGRAKRSSKDKACWVGADFKVCAW